MISGASSPRVSLARTSPRTRNCCPRLLESTWSSKTTHSVLCWGHPPISAASGAPGFSTPHIVCGPGMRSGSPVLTLDDKTNTIGA